MRTQWPRLHILLVANWIVLAAAFGSDLLLRAPMRKESRLSKGHAPLHRPTKRGACLRGGVAVGGYRPLHKLVYFPICVEVGWLVRSPGGEVLGIGVPLSFLQHPLLDPAGPRSHGLHDWFERRRRK